MPRKKGKKYKKPVYTLEVLFFIAADIADKSQSKELKDKFIRIEKSYNKYVQSLNCNDNDTKQRGIVLRKQLSLFIEQKKH